MSRVFKYILFGLNFIRCSPHFIIFLLHKNRSIIKADIRRWNEVLKISYSISISFIYLLSFHKAFRNVFYFRIGEIYKLINLFCPQISTLIIEAKVIGEGLYIWHGFATAIGAKSIGKNCMINHNVTLGTHNGYPIIMDNVRIHPGAIVFGNITVGNNVVIGANTIVYKDVPDNTTVFARPSQMIRWEST